MSAMLGLIMAGHLAVKEVYMVPTVRGVQGKSESFKKSGNTERVRESRGILKVPECKKVL